MTTLPAGKTCRDCAHFARCEMLFSADRSFPSSTECDWDPSRFVEPVAPIPKPAPGAYVSPLWPPPGDPRQAHKIVPGTKECAPDCPCWAARRRLRPVEGGRDA